MIQALNFEELGNHPMGSMFSLIKDAGEVLFVGHLYFEKLMIHCPLRILKATRKLQNMENIMDMRKFRWHLEFISHLFMRGENVERTNVARS